MGSMYLSATHSVKLLGLISVIHNVNFTLYIYKQMQYSWYIQQNSTNPIHNRPDGYQTIRYSIVSNRTLLTYVHTL
jgi:hypothetical protein